jgi:hypothetical protein
MAGALVGAWRSLGDDVVGWGVWVVGADLVHDLLVAPLVGAAGLLVARLVPAGWARAHVQAGLLVSGALLLVAWVPLVGWGGNPGNPTIRPLDYRSATLTVLGVVWAIVGVSAARHVVRARRSASN